MTDKNSEPTRIVGIGASAGGLSPIEEFFDHMPDDTGMAFVVVQHLSPDFESMMDELLSRHTTMAIHKVVDRIEVQPNSIYLIPREKNMAFSDGKLLLTDQEEKRALNLPIDFFFHSMGKSAGRSAVAIVLSGSGSDGSRGVVQVHEAGGIVMVQDTESAAFDGMPRAAIRTGIASCIGNPTVLAERLVKFQSSDDEESLAEATPSIQRSEIRSPESAIFNILRLFRMYHGVDFALYKPATISRRINRRLQMGKFPDLIDYANHLEEDRGELDLLFRDLLVEVTEFFRDAEAFRVLEESVIPRMLDRAEPDQEIRIWVPGCATGEEAYSLAILLAEAIENHERDFDFRVFATDVHRSSLETASLAVYPASATSKIPESLQRKYFTKNGGLSHIKRELRQRVIFAANDLTNDPPFTRLDLISCRNVLIYLETKIQKRILSLFHFGLRVGGTLFLGPSETVGELANEFESVDRHWRIYTKRRDVRLPDAARLPVAPALQTLIQDKPATIIKSPLMSRDKWLNSAYEDLLSRHVPPSLLIDESGKLIHSFGDARNFLIQPEGRPTLDALKMMPNTLRTVVSAGLHRAKNDGSPVIFQNVVIEIGKEELTFRVTVEPYQKTTESVFLVSIERDQDSELSTPAKSVLGKFDPESFSNERITQLEKELGYTRETLQATVEELETSNEELQSTNEELIASNEELQSTNEELHSVNEELYTVNSEHKQKIEELTHLTSDMDNLLKSTDIGTIFLDEEFRIRLFTPAISSAFNVMEQDIGRPIEHIAYKLDSPHLIRDAAQVLQTGVPVEVEVQNHQGHTYLQRIQPYRTEMGQIKGIVLTTTNVTAVREEERAERKLDSLAQIREELPDFAYAVSHDLQAPLRHITHYAQILEQEAAQSSLPNLGRATRVIVESAAKLRSMIDGVLAYSRINTLGEALGRVPLADVVSDAIQQLKSNVEFYDASISFDVLPAVIGDPNQLEQLFFHVLDNSLKYSHPDRAPSVEIEASCHLRQVHVVIRDNGIGIEKRHAERVFAIFKRLGFKESVPGTGLGLALCRRIVVRHGGKIWFEPNPEGGTECHFILREFSRPNPSLPLPGPTPTDDAPKRTDDAPKLEPDS
ncbi:MAG: CheR family methyltransferase [Planctomycetota bacterium]